MTIDKQTNLTSTRRQFLKSALAVGATSLLPNAVFAQSSSPNIFVWITLRGAMDGLNVVVPYADKQYLTLRPTFGLGTEKLN
ncbi:twin-arginine translocation signal domain-containing protein, partial [Vibrio owensii]